MNHIPVVFDSAPLADFMTWVLAHHAIPTTLVVCMERDAFLAQLKSSINKSTSCWTKNSHFPGDSKAEEMEDNPRESYEGNHERGNVNPHNQPHILCTRAIRVLAAASTVNLAFCSSVSSLRAYLSTFAYKKENSLHSRSSISEDGGRLPILAVINFVTLHTETQYYSVQGLSHSFAVAVEAAFGSGLKPVFVECLIKEFVRNTAVSDATENIEMADMQEPLQEGDGRMAVSPEVEDIEQSPWDEQVPVLNATTRTYGEVGRDSLYERTSSVASIAMRWCRFEEFPGPADIG